MDFKNIDLIKQTFLKNSPEIVSLSVYNYILQGETSYFHVRVQTSIHEWEVYHRFSEFIQLRNNIKTAFAFLSDASPILPEEPPRYSKILVNHSDSSFLKKRCVALAQFMNQLKKIPSINTSNVFREFLFESSPELVLRKNIKKRKLSTAGIQLRDVTDVSVDSWTFSQDHVIYHIRFSNRFKEGPYSSWLCLKRYEEFDGFLEKLKEYVEKLPSSENTNGLTVDDLPVLPKKHLKLIKDHTNKKFLEERRMGLEEFLRGIIDNHVLVNSPIFLEFAGFFNVKN